MYQKYPEIFQDAEFLSIANLPCTYENGDGINFPCTDTITDAPNLFTGGLFNGGPAIANIHKDSLDLARLYFEKLSKKLNNKYLFYFTNSPNEPSKFRRDKYHALDVTDERYIQVIALDNSNGPILTGNSIESAQQNIDILGRPTVSLTMNNSGAIKWSKATAQLMPYGEKPADHVAVVLDKEVYCYPRVMQQLSFYAEISGNLDFDIKEAQNIAKKINEKKK